MTTTAKTLRLVSSYERRGKPLALVEKVEIEALSRYANIHDYVNERANVKEMCSQMEMMKSRGKGFHCSTLSEMTK